MTNHETIAERIRQLRERARAISTKDPELSKRLLYELARTEEQIAEARDEALKLESFLQREATDD